MSQISEDDYDYTVGAPRPHHSLYMDDGTLVIQVENAIFKVHRSILAKESSVLKSMLEVPHESKNPDGLDSNPLVLAGDSALNWELYLESHYDSSHFWDPYVLTNKRLLGVLTIAHKYCMERTEEAIIKRLKNPSTVEGYVDLLVASRIIDSNPLYEQALKGLRDGCNPKPTFEQAKRMGFQAYFDVMNRRSVAEPYSYSFSPSIIRIPASPRRSYNPVYVRVSGPSHYRMNYY